MTSAELTPLIVAIVGLAGAVTAYLKARVAHRVATSAAINANEATNNAYHALGSAGEAKSAIEKLQAPEPEAKSDSPDA